MKRTADGNSSGRPAKRAARDVESLYLTVFLPELRAIVRDFLDDPVADPWRNTRDRVALQRTCRLLYADDKPGIVKLPRVWLQHTWPPEFPGWMHTIVAEFARYARPEWPATPEIKYEAEKKARQGRDIVITGDTITVTWRLVQPKENLESHYGPASRCVVEVTHYRDAYVWKSTVCAFGCTTYAFNGTLADVISKRPFSDYISVCPLR